MEANNELPGQSLYNKWRLKDYERGIDIMPLSLFSLAIQERDAEWKLKCEELEQWKREALLVMNPILDYGQSHPDIKLGQSITSFVIERCKKYDELKADYEQYVKDFDQLFDEHAALKERAQGLVDALDEIIDMSNAGKTLSHIDSHVAQRARTALQSWNQGKEGGV